MLRNRIYPHFDQRLWILALFFMVGLGLLTWRLGQVQLQHASKYDASVSRQSLRRILLEPVRGRILAADGTVLVDNRACYDLIFHPNEMRQPRVPGKSARTHTLDYILENAYELAEKLKRPTPITRAQLETHLRISPAMGITIFRDLTPREMAALTEMSPPIPGTEIVPRIIRAYPYPGIASHLLGFTAKQPREPPGLNEEGEEEETGGGPRFAYLPPALVGRQGLEYACDAELSGKPGEKTVQVDILGYIHSEIGAAIPPQHGGDLVLTLDLRAQLAAERALRGQTGAMVVLDVNTGAVLALASWPSYDLATLTAESYKRLAANKIQRPLVNRAVSGSYQPGSILKPLTALAALQSGALSATETITCTGSYRITPASKPIGCWKTEGHGTVGMVQALSQSCNSYFIHAGMSAGLDHLLPILQAAGLGQETGLELGGSGGFLPSREWAATSPAHNRQPWSAFDTALLSIGQGPVTITPVQAAVYTAAIANGGTVFRPYLVQSVRGADNTMLRQTAPLGDRHLPVMQKELAIIHQGMWDAVNGEKSTAASARNPYITIAGKTGTAEVIQSGGERHKNTWFIGYAPADTPKYAIAIVVERGQSGGHTASPVACRFLTEWLGPKTPGATPLPAATVTPDPDLESANTAEEPAMEGADTPAAETATE